VDNNEKILSMIKQVEKNSYVVKKIDKTIKGIVKKLKLFIKRIVKIRTNSLTLLVALAII